MVSRGEPETTVQIRHVNLDQARHRRDRGSQSRMNEHLRASRRDFSNHLRSTPLADS
jgi:hypothetical protein